MSFTFGSPTSTLKPKYFRPGQPAPIAQPIPKTTIPPVKTPQQIYLESRINQVQPKPVDPNAALYANQAAAAAGAGRAANTASTAASTSGQTQQQAQGATMGNAASSATPSGYMFNGVTYKTESDRNMAAAAAGANAASNTGSAAANQVGQRTEQAQGATQANAANVAAIPAGVQPPAPTAPQDFSLTKQPWITESGRLYERGVEDRLTGADPLVKNAQNTADTNASRRGYMATKDMQESAAQAKYQPGTIQYQRMKDYADSGVNSANLAGQNGVNDFTRQRSAEAMDMAKGLESTAYGMTTDKQNFQVGERNYTDNRGDIQYQRGVNENQTAYNRTRDAQGDAIAAEDKTYTRGITERTYADTKALLAKGDVTGAINSVQSQKAKNYLNKVRADGGDVNAAISGIYEANGTLKPEFRDSSPVADIRAQAEEWVNLVSPGLDPTAKEAAVVKRMQDLDATKQGPVTAEAKVQEIEAVKAKDRSGIKLSPTEEELMISSGAYQEFTPQTLPTGSNANALVGTKVNIGGQAYKVTKADYTRTSGGGGNYPRHTDWTELEDSSGNKVYAYNGAFYSTPPKPG